MPRSVGQLPVFYGHKVSGGRSHWHGEYVDGPTSPLYPFMFVLPNGRLFDAGPDTDRVRSADGQAETVRCGPGFDRLLADAAARPARCEAIRLR
jgi:hypothetical protein